MNRRLISKIQHYLVLIIFSLCISFSSVYAGGHSKVDNYYMECVNDNSYETYYGEEIFLQLTVEEIFLTKEVGTSLWIFSNRDFANGNTSREHPSGIRNIFIGENLHSDEFNSPSQAGIWFLFLGSEITDEPDENHTVLFDRVEYMLTFNKRINKGLKIEDRYETFFCEIYDDFWEWEKKAVNYLSDEFKQIHKIQ